MRPHLAQRIESIRLLNMPLGRLDERGCVETIMASLAQGDGGWVITSNVDILRRYVRDARFRKLAAGATLFVADGMPLIWASIVQGARLPERVAGSNLIVSISAAAAREGRSVFLLGGDDGTAEAAAAVLRRHSPTLQVAGTCCPPPGFEADPAQMQAIRAALEQTRPDIVFVALGCPKQEALIAALREAWPATWWIGVGISFSFLAGRVTRAPRWVQQAGMEWLHRLCQEPRRLSRRYLLHGIPFTLYLMGSAAVLRLRRLWQTPLLTKKSPGAVDGGRGVK